MLRPLYIVLKRILLLRTGSWLLFIWMTLLNTSVMGQVPKKVKTAFENRYKTAKDVVWSGATDNRWVVKFEHLGESKTAFYQLSGEWEKTIIQLDVSNLKYCLRDEITTQFPEAKITEAYATRDAKGLIYTVEAQLKKEDSPTIFHTLQFTERCELINH